MKFVEVLLKILLTLVLPTPKNLKALFGMFNGAIADMGGDGEHKLTEDQWAELRRMRDKP